MVISEREILLDVSEVIALSHWAQEENLHLQARHGRQIIDRWCRNHIGPVERVWFPTPDVAVVQALRFASAGDLLVFRMRWLGC